MMPKFDSNYWKQMHSNPYVQTLIESGYDASDCRKPAAKQVPAHLQDRYSSYEEYQQAIHDFLNEN